MEISVLDYLHIHTHFSSSWGEILYQFKILSLMVYKPKFSQDKFLGTLLMLSSSCKWKSHDFEFPTIN